MLATYKATLRGNHLEWSGEIPGNLSPDKTVAVYVTVLDEPVVSTANVSQGQLMADALEQLAALPARTVIPDPATWEREMRQDRPLPDREL